MNKQELSAEVKSKTEKLLPKLRENNKPIDGKELFVSAERESFVRILTIEENSLFESIIDDILEDKSVFKNYSEEFVRNKFIDFCHKLLKKDATFEIDVTEFISSLLTPTVNEYLIYSQLENIRLIDDIPYQLIDSTIKILKKEDIPKYAQSFFAKDLIKKPAIFTKVKAGEPVKAQELAMHNFTISLNLLKLYAPSFRPILKGSLRSGYRELHAINETQKSSYVSQTAIGYLPLNVVSLNNDSFIKLVNSGIEKLKTDSAFSKAVKEGLYWFGLGLEEKHPSAKLVNFVTVLEVILKKNGDTELGRAISERGAILLGNDFDSRIRVRDDLKQIYKVRSKVVHAGELIDDTKIAVKAGQYASAILMKVIGACKFDEGFDSFIKNLDDAKLTGKNFFE